MRLSWPKLGDARRLVMPAAVFALGLCLSAMAAWQLMRSLDALARTDFERHVERVVDEAGRRIRQPVHGLNGANGMFALDPAVDRSAFRAFVATRDLPREFPGMRGLGFLQRVQHADLSAFEAAQRADGAPGFSVRAMRGGTTDAGRHPHWVIKYMEPAADHAALPGLDVGADTARREAIERAVATGQPALTAVTALPGRTQPSPGFVLYLPVFRHGAPLSTPAQRHAGLVGLLFAPVAVHDTPSGELDVFAGAVDVALFDNAGQLALGASSPGSAAAGPASADTEQPRFESLRTLPLFGRDVTVRVRSKPVFEAQHPRSAPWAVLAGGLVVSLLLAVLFRRQAFGRRRAEALAEHMTADLDRLAQIARHTTNAVLITDRRLRITWVNAGFTRISGYTQEEALGRTPGELLGSGKADPAVLRTLAAAAAGGVGCRVEVLYRHKDGGNYWIDIEVQPLRDASGQVTGFMEIGTDISANKQAAQELGRERLRLNNILEGTHVGTWEWNVETGKTVFNERWAQMFGYSLAELGDTTISTLYELAHPADLKRSAVQLAQHFNARTPGYECEMRLRHKRGHWIWVLSRGKLFSRNEDGRPRWMAGTYQDITERKQAEAALQASQAFLDRTGRIGGVGGWQFDVATQAVQWTDQTFRIHDLEPGRQPTVGEAVGYCVPAARPLIEQAMHDSLAGGPPYDLELPYVTAKGRSIWVRAVGEAEFADGKPVRLVGALQDITARRELEADLRQNNEVMRSVLESLPCGLTVFGPDLRLMASNEAYRRMMDLPPALLAQSGVQLEEIVRFDAARGGYGDVDIEATVQAVIGRARAATAPQQHERLRGDGTLLEIRRAPMPGGGFVTTYTDISERKLAEARLQQASDLLRGSIDALDEAFALFDPDDCMVLCNQRYRDLYPLAADLMVTGNTFEQIIRGGAARGQYAAAVGREEAWVQERMAVHRQPASELQTRLCDGRTMRVVERRMPDGHTVGFRVDITAFIRATEAAQEASRSKSQFLANMSHEIRTPMNAILGMLALLRKTELTTRQADYAQKTEGAAHSLLGLLNDILDFSKVEAGKMTLDPQPFRVDQLMRDLSVILSANAGSKNIEVLFDVDPQLPRHLVGDAMRLMQVLINLGGNAIKFTERGEVVVSVAVTARTQDAVVVRIGVRDSGIGIAPENQARIFSGFTQAEASTTRRFGGTGLGLAISQRMVALMGGELQLDSEFGQGSRFHFEVALPLAPDEPGAAADDLPVALPGRLRALVVDDNATAREVLERMVDSLGWEVELAASGEEALKRLQARPGTFDAVFVDWLMPGMDGWQTCEQIRVLSLSGGAPLMVMVTAHGREMLAQRSVEQQALIDGFLVKPVTASMLYDAIVDARAERGGTPRPRKDVAAHLRRLEGFRLLVAEDNANNQQVARELLEDEGAVVQIVNNGLEAVQAVAVADPPFDVVLMDLQMPVMDGYTATSRIRQALGRMDLPIVAMTANAMASDREACLAAGMNDHVGKPFDLDQLVKVLRRLTGRSMPQLPSQPAAPPTAAFSPEVVAAAQAAGVDLATAVRRLGGKLGVYRRSLGTFVGDLGAIDAALADPPGAEGIAAAARELHTLKGVAATLGATRLAGAAADGERLLNAEPTPAQAAQALSQVRQTIAALRSALGALCEALDGALPGPQEPASASDCAPPSPEDSAALIDALTLLKDMLAESDMGAIDAVAGLRTRFRHTTSPALNPLEQAIGELDFEDAQRHCHDWLTACQAQGVH